MVEKFSVETLTLSIPTGEDMVVDLDLTFNPDVVYDLEATDELQHKIDGSYDGFGNAIVSNEDYVVVAASNALTYWTNEDYSSKEAFFESNKNFNDGAIQIYDKSSGNVTRVAIGNIASELGYSYSEGHELFSNSQFGSSLAIEGDKLVVGAARLDSRGANLENDTKGSAFNRFKI